MKSPSSALAAAAAAVAVVMALMTPVHVGALKCWECQKAASLEHCQNVGVEVDCDGGQVRSAVP